MLSLILTPYFSSTTFRHETERYRVSQDAIYNCLNQYLDTFNRFKHDKNFGRLNLPSVNWVYIHIRNQLENISFNLPFKLPEPVLENIFEILTIIHPPDFLFDHISRSFLLETRFDFFNFPLISDLLC